MYQQVSIDQLASMADAAKAILRNVLAEVSKPKPRKTPPTFSSTYIAALIGVDKADIRHLAVKHDLSYGQKVEGNKSRDFTLAEVIAWSIALGKWPKRPAGKLGRTIAVVNYKGGVAKTSTAIMLAQSLTLRGLKVLVIDCDGQGTSTQLCGINPEENVDPDETILPLVFGDESSLEYAVQPTYWENLSIIPSCSLTLEAEYALPARAIKQRGFNFFGVLEAGIAPLKADFDVIILDTSPSLSNVTMNCMLAADGLVMPCPPEQLDFASSVQFWGLYNGLLKSLQATPVGEIAREKIYDFVTVLPTKVKSIDSHRLVKMWMRKAYGVFMNHLEIPDSDAAKSASALMKTIYDLDKPLGSKEAHNRLKDPADSFCNQVLDELAISWNRP